MTGRGADGGVDVVAAAAVAQVKAEVVPVGAPVVQQTFGIASARGVAGLVFALAGFTPAAVRFAEDAGVALFRFDLQSQVEPVNAAARALSDGESGLVLADHERRLIRRSIELGVTDLVAAETPRVGLRATPERLAAWAAHVSASIDETEADINGWYARLELELGGGAAPIGRLGLGAGSGADGEPTLFVWTEGERFGGLRRVSVIPGSRPAWFAQVAVGTADEVTSDRVPRQRSVSLRYLRVVERKQRPDLGWEVTAARGDALVEDPRTEPFAEIEHVLDQRGHVRIITDPGRHWREARFEVLEHDGARLVFVVVPDLSWSLIPGSRGVQAALAYHLPDSRDVLGDDLAKPALSDEQVMAAVVAPRGQAELALAVMVEACTLDAEDLLIR